MSTVVRTLKGRTLGLGYGGEGVVEVAPLDARAITLYGMSSPNVFKLSIMLEEAELAYRLQYVNVFAREQQRPAFLALSPNARVPAIHDPQGPDGAPFGVFESGAALIYLAEKSGRLLPEHGEARSSALQWLMFQTAAVGPMFGQYVHFARHAPSGQTYGQGRFGAEALRLCDVMEHRLETSPYLGGELYSIADVATFPWIRTALTVFPMFQADDGARLWSDRPALRRWFEAMGSRPAVERGVAALEPFASLDRGAFAAASAHALDIFFGRTAAAAFTRD